MKSDSTFQPLNRRRFIHASAALGLLAGLQRIMPAYAGEDTGLKAGAVGDSAANEMDLMIREEQLQFGNRRGTAIVINGTVPGPLVHLREGSDALLRVTNGLREASSIHWHGLLLPPGMDGVPGVSFAGIKAGEAYTCRFPVRQNGTFWYHSHSAGQEQSGHDGPLIIDAARPEPLQYDREHVVVPSDWTSENPMRVMARLKRRQTITISNDARSAPSCGTWQRMDSSPPSRTDWSGVACAWTHPTSRTSRVPPTRI